MPEARWVWVFPGTAKIDVILPDGTHRYWSTHCRHGNHAACAADSMRRTVSGTAQSIVVEKNPAACKHCSAPCLCSCHTSRTEGETA